jgi:uncharacterized protein with beta-barrel porin domain
LTPGANCGQIRVVLIFNQLSKLALFSGMSSMCGRSRAGERGTGRTLATTAVAVVLLLALTAASSSARAARLPPPPPVLDPSPAPTDVNAGLSAGSTATNLGSNFLERLGDQATNGFGRALRSNPGGGGASEAAEAPLFRTWTELYGISARTGAQADFVGDKRTTWGGVAGIGARVAPGVNVGFSMDQSRTSIDVPLALQSATLDLTQFGFNASIDKGPWTWAIAVVHGLGNVDSRRDTGLGIAGAGYTTGVDGALTELSYYWTSDQSRIVPKVALEYVRGTTGAFRETGGLDPVNASSAALERSRVLIGAEVGHYFIIDQKILDLSGYGKFVDNFSQNISSVLVSLGSQSIAVQGIAESQYGADAGASASLSLSDTARIYANYDGKFRAAYQSHQGTVGVEFRW